MEFEVVRFNGECPFKDIEGLLVLLDVEKELSEYEVIPDVAGKFLLEDLILFDGVVEVEAIESEGAEPPEVVGEEGFFFLG